MRIITFPILFTCAMASLSAQAANPSFDCTNTTHEAEQMICKDAELAKLDRRLATLYSSVLKQTSEQDRKTLKAEQRGWVKGRDDCWKDSDMRGCIADAYQSRIRQLKDD